MNWTLGWIHHKLSIGSYGDYKLHLQRLGCGRHVGWWVCVPQHLERGDAGLAYACWLRAQHTSDPCTRCCACVQVTRSTFLRALRERAAVILCPGGQAELVHTWKAFHRDGKQRKLVLYGRHKGFCRIAIEQQAHLVPVLALGEMLQLENMFNFPALQKMTYKRIGFPVPFVLVGRWGLTPLPRKTPLVYVVGQPLQPPLHEPGE